MMQSAAIKESKFRALPADWLPLCGVLVLFLYSAISVLRGRGPIHFELACAILILLLARHWIEVAGRIRACKSLEKLQRLLPDHVRVVQDNVEEIVSRDGLAIGDRVCALAGHRFVSDGRIVEGIATVDEQMITGDGRPVKKPSGAQVYGGTLNLNGAVVVELTAAPSDGMVPRLIQAVFAERAQTGRYEVRADRLARLLFTAVALAALIALTWHTVYDGLDRGVMCALAVVVIASPGLIPLGTGLAVGTALARAAGEHILLRGGNALERLAGIKAICFAKTGTLTGGDPRVIDYIVADVSRESEILSIAAALARTSPHVYSVAIADFAHRITVPATVEARSVAGCGVMARVEGGADWAYLGSPRFIKEAGLAMNEAIRDVYRKSVEEGLPTVFAGWDGRIQVLFVFAETLRPCVHTLLQAMQTAGKKCTVLTGDHWQSALVLTSDPGVSVLTDLAPEEKPRRIRALRDRVGAVAMVGDGINDAPAMAAADIGIALGCGADVSNHLADVCLLGSDPGRLPWLFALADATSQTIRRNLFRACAYNIIGMGLAMTGMITPILACLLMVGTSALVIASSLHLRRFEFEPVEAEPPGICERTGDTDRDTSEVGALNPATIVLPQSGNATC